MMWWGNVAEMIDEKGKACGGSWNDPPSESTIHSIKNYRHSDASIGFRVFMDQLSTFPDDEFGLIFL